MELHRARSDFSNIGLQQLFVLCKAVVVVTLSRIILELVLVGCALRVLSKHVTLMVWLGTWSLLVWKAVCDFSYCKIRLLGESSIVCFCCSFLHWFLGTIVHHTTDGVLAVWKVCVCSRLGLVAIWGCFQILFQMVKSQQRACLGMVFTWSITTTPLYSISCVWRVYFLFSSSHEKLH